MFDRKRPLGDHEFMGVTGSCLMRWEPWPAMPTLVDVSTIGAEMALAAAVARTIVAELRALAIRVTLAMDNVRLWLGPLAARGAAHCQDLARQVRVRTVRAHIRTTTDITNARMTLCKLDGSCVVVDTHR